MPLFEETMIYAALSGLFSFFLIMIDKENRPDTIIYSSRAWIVGILLLLCVTVINSFVENRWTYDYIHEFLFLKNVGEWMFRILAGLGYVLVIVSSASFLALGLKAIIRKKDRHSI